MIDIHKSASLSLFLTVAVLSSWQITEAADAVRGRHSLIHRPQIQPAPAASSAQPQLQSAPPSPLIPSPPVPRKIVRRPAALPAPLADVTPMTPINSAQEDSPGAPSQVYHPDNAPPEPELISPPDPPESPNTDAR